MTDGKAPSGMCLCPAAAPVGDGGVLCTQHERYVEQRLRFRRFRPDELAEVRQQVYLALVEARAAAVIPGQPFEYWLRDLVRRPARTFIDRRRRQRARFVSMGDCEPAARGAGLEHELVEREQARRGRAALAEAREAYIAAGGSAGYDRGRFFDVVVLQMGAMVRSLEAADYARLASLFPPLTDKPAGTGQGAAVDATGYLRVRVNGLRKHIRAGLADVVDEPAAEDRRVSEGAAGDGIPDGQVPGGR